MKRKDIEGEGMKFNLFGISYGFCGDTVSSLTSRASVGAQSRHNQDYHQKLFGL